MDEQKRRHAGKRLLVAAIGVATVSYVSTQTGCAADGADGPDDALSAGDAPYDDEEEVDVEGREQELAVGLAKATTSVTAVPITTLPIKVRPKFPPVGNLVFPPPVGNLVAPPPVGNLVPPPVIKPPVVVPEPPVGNLMAPPIVPTEIVIELPQVRGE
jgi:hypothetical protein